MTTEEIVEAVYAAGFSTSEMMTRLPAFKRLIESAAAAEREVCAKLCEQVGEPNPDDPNSALGEYYRDSVCYECAEAIRARSQK